MKQILTLVILGVLIWVGLKFNTYFNTAMREAREKAGDVPKSAPGKLPGMAPDLEPSLETARKGGADGLRNWLRQHRSDVEDPRRAEIEMDYVVLVGRSDAAEAKRVLAGIKQRLPTSSPLQKRLQQLEKVYR